MISAQFYSEMGFRFFFACLFLCVASLDVQRSLCPLLFELLKMCW